MNTAELFDISNDPGEMSDVAVEHPEIVERLRTAYDRWWAYTLPLMINEGLPTIRPEEQPLALRYANQVKETGIPEWAPSEWFELKVR